MRVLRQLRLLWFYTAILQVAKTLDLVKAKGGKVTREPGLVKGGTTVTASIEDPDGYKFELLERRPTSEPLCQVMLRVGDLDRAIAFYQKVSALAGLIVKVPSACFDVNSQVAKCFSLPLLISKAVGMKLLHKMDNPEHKVTTTCGY